MQEVAKRQDYSRKQHGNYDVRPHRPAAAEPPTEPSQKRKIKKSRRKPLIIIVAGLVIIIVAASIGGLLYMNSNKSLVPKNLRQSVDFPVYYPDENQLPAGYTLNKSSFTSPERGVILYAVDYNGGKLVFSVQQKPAAEDLKAFNTQRIPLHTTLKTKVGEAIIGAIGEQSIVSLPTDSDAWIIVTGSYATDQTKLATVLNSMRQ